MLTKSIPTIFPKSIAYKLILAFVGSIILALLAQLRIPVPFSPVPITGQTFGVLLIGGILGSQIGIMSIILYLLEGISGLPVFAGIGAGPAYLLGPTGGYLLGFIPAAFITGLIIENLNEVKLYKTFTATFIGTALIFIFGLSWLGIQIGWTNVLQIGLFPYIPGAVLKIIIASILIYGFHRQTS
jgi:biotin transport system substrate-specific component